MASGSGAPGGRPPGTTRQWPLLRAEVVEHSMLPTLRTGDWLVARRTRKIRPGDIVLAWHPARDGFMLVKRAIREAEGGWWVESDFPEAPGARDSREFGPVPADRIIGRVVARYYPVRTARPFRAQRHPAG